MPFDSDIRVDAVAESVHLITLNRPAARNALRTQTLEELAATLDEMAANENVRAVVLTGGPVVFAAGADLKEMAELDLIATLNDPRQSYRNRISRFPKPLLAAVNGFALGGGCELAMQCDIIIAGDNARFGQPEINLGIMPGAGGTQRLIRAVGKSLAMKMVLAGEMIDAHTALNAGLVAEITPPELTLERAIALAKAIAAKPPLAVRLAKEALLKALETPLETGLDMERKAYNLLAATEDRREGIAAFLEKRRPRFVGR
ncbi:MAG: 2,3-dehydroadipyl-CoA hydratase [Gammaproteobacteria bacterium]|nr:2,3-dehydroadipyl-CoA hydratase [Gammaproteobacteria bacterium]MCP5425673.1 2,3-dehydroadipyl-CoA hydratase [Gammaproteobacteria bacterium]MCP5459704.1 2,3-dehydroadipyl-CoA hydratase [Gammaproteobacteria bacterium]